MMPRAWRNRAACADYPTAWWFPNRRAATPETVSALAICKSCPVRLECHTEAEATRSVGIWAGKRRGRD